MTIITIPNIRSWNRTMFVSKEATQEEVKPEGILAGVSKSVRYDDILFVHLLDKWYVVCIKVACFAS